LLGYLIAIRLSDPRASWASSITPTPSANTSATANLIDKLDKALDDALVIGWTLVDMKRDWR
jgi:hypothetical protein